MHLIIVFSGIFACTFLEASWRRCHSSSGFSLSQFVLFLHVIPDRLDDEFISLCGALAAVRQKPHWIIRINDKLKVWKCKLIFPTDTFSNIEITDLKPFKTVENTSVLNGHHCIDEHMDGQTEVER